LEFSSVNHVFCQPKKKDDEPHLILC